MKERHKQDLYHFIGKEIRLDETAELLQSNLHHFTNDQLEVLSVFFNNIATDATIYPQEKCTPGDIIPILIGQWNSFIDNTRFIRLGFKIKEDWDEESNIVTIMENASDLAAYINGWAPHTVLGGVGKYIESIVKIED